MKKHPDDDVDELLNTPRELTQTEMDRLREATTKTWQDVAVTLAERAHATYSVAATDDFIQCVSEHMDHADRAEMVVAGVYTCPQCSRLLKDRQSPVAAAVLVERHRLRQLWLDVESASEEERPRLMARFRRGLGLSVRE